MTRYYLAYDDGNMIIRNRLNSLLERYDEAQKKWIPDVELSRIFFGDMPVKPLTPNQVAGLLRLSK